MPKFTSLVTDALTASGEITCTWVVPDEEEDWLECGNISRYVVERSDGDRRFGSCGGTEESCEKHLAETVANMVDGDDRVRAVVSIRWNGPETLEEGTDD